MAGDLVSSHYPLSQALQALLGAGGQKAQGNLPIRSNLELPVYSGALADTAASLTSGVMTAVPVPVDVGMEVSNISVLVGATPASTPTHQWAALYSGTTVAAPPLIAQTADGATAAIAASGRYDFAFAAGSQQVITPAQAPYGYVWVAISVTGTTVPSLITTPAGAAAGQYRWFTNTPLYFSQTSGSAVGATAPATLAEASVLTTAPVVFLW
jgi:hypothetical protein